MKRITLTAIAAIVVICPAVADAVPDQAQQVAEINQQLTDVVVTGTPVRLMNVTAHKFGDNLVYCGEIDATNILGERYPGFVRFVARRDFVNVDYPITGSYELRRDFETLWAAACN